MVKKQLINPKGSEQIYQSMQFSQAIKCKNTIWVSGQVGVDEKLKVVQGIEKQTQMAFQNLEKVLKEAGSGLEEIVELVTYHTSMKEIGGFSKVKAKFIPENYPAWTAVGVTELVLPDLLVEIKATAIIS